MFVWGHQIPWKWSYRQSWTTIWVLGIEPRSFGRAASALKSWAISPAPTLAFLCHLIWHENTLSLLGLFSGCFMCLFLLSDADQLLREELVSAVAWSLSCRSLCAWDPILTFAFGGRFFEKWLGVADVKGVRPPWWYLWLYTKRTDFSWCTGSMI